MERTEKAEMPQTTLCAWCGLSIMGERAYYRGDVFHEGCLKDFHEQYSKGMEEPKMIKAKCPGKCGREVYKEVA